MQGPKNTVKLMVSATLVGGQREKHSKTNGCCVAPRPKLFKRYKNQWYFDARLQERSKTNGFSNLSRGETEKAQ